jgi:hypothetical protein
MAEMETTAMMRRCKQCGARLEHNPTGIYCGAACCAMAEAHEPVNYSRLLGLAEHDLADLRKRVAALEVELISVVIERNTYRETCKNAQERGTVKHEQVVRVRNLLRRVRTEILLYVDRGIDPRLIEELSQSIDAELARSID